MNREIEEYATVDEVIEILKKVSEQGKGNYIVGCNYEYYLARKDEKPDINDKYKQVDLGGHT